MTAGRWCSRWRSWRCWVAGGVGPRLGGGADRRGAAGVDATNTILHGDAWYGLALVLLAGAGIATRMVRRAVPAV